MEYSDATMLSFYQLLGRVFFAAAQADGVIREEEQEALKKCVRELWLDVDHTFDAFHTDTAYQIEIVFDYLLKEGGQPTEEVLNELKAFKSEHGSLFSPGIVDLIMETTNEIVSSFAQSNKSEVVYLTQLHFILRK